MQSTDDSECVNVLYIKSDAQMGVNQDIAHVLQSV